MPAAAARPLPGARPIAPGCPVEVTTLGVPMPRAAGVRIRSTESVGVIGVIAGPARSAGVITGSAGVIVGSNRAAGATGVIVGAAWAAGVIVGSAGAAGVIVGSAGAAWATRVIAGSAGTTRSTRATRIVRTSGSVATTRSRPAMIARRLWRSGSSVGKPGAHSQGRSAECTGDGHPADKLLQLHDAFAYPLGISCQEVLWKTPRLQPRR